VKEFLPLIPGGLATIGGVLFIAYNVLPQQIPESQRRLFGVMLILITWLTYAVTVWYAPLVFFNMPATMVAPLGLGILALGALLMLQFRVHALGPVTAMLLSVAAYVGLNAGLVAIALSKQRIVVLLPAGTNLVLAATDDDSVRIPFWHVFGTTGSVIVDTIPHDHLTLVFPQCQADVQLTAPSHQRGLADVFDLRGEECK
jgi:hypothetical protein